MCSSPPRTGTPPFGGGVWGISGSTSFAQLCHCHPGPVLCPFSVLVCLRGNIHTHAPLPCCSSLPPHTLPVLPGQGRQHEVNKVGWTPGSTAWRTARGVCWHSPPGAQGSEPTSIPTRLLQPHCWLLLLLPAAGAICGELWGKAQSIACGCTCSLWSVLLLVY